MKLRSVLSRVFAAGCVVVGSASAALAEATSDFNVDLTGIQDKIFTAGNAVIPVLVTLVGGFLIFRIIKKA